MSCIGLEVEVIEYGKRKTLPMRVSWDVYMTSFRF